MVTVIVMATVMVLIIYNGHRHVIEHGTGNVCIHGHNFCFKVMIVNHVHNYCFCYDHFVRGIGPIMEKIQVYFFFMIMVMVMVMVIVLPFSCLADGP